MDPHIGPKPIGTITEVHEDSRGAYFTAQLFPVGYAMDLIPALATGQLGASFRFSVDDEELDSWPLGGDHNPTRLPERTIRAVSVREFGPVTFPAYAGATVGVGSVAPRSRPRSLTDAEFIAKLNERPAARRHFDRCGTSSQGE